MKSHYRVTINGKKGIETLRGTKYYATVADMIEKMNDEISPSTYYNLVKNDGKTSDPRIAQTILKTFPEVEVHFVDSEGGEILLGDKAKS